MSELEDFWAEMKAKAVDATNEYVKAVESLTSGDARAAVRSMPTSRSVRLHEAIKHDERLVLWALEMLIDERTWSFNELVRAIHEEAGIPKT